MDNGLRERMVKNICVYVCVYVYVCVCIYIYTRSISYETMTFKLAAKR